MSIAHQHNSNITFCDGHWWVAALVVIVSIIGEYGNAGKLSNEVQYNSALFYLEVSEWLMAAAAMVAAVTCRKEVISLHSPI